MQNSEQNKALAFFSPAIAMCLAVDLLAENRGMRAKSFFWSKSESFIFLFDRGHAEMAAVGLPNLLAVLLEHRACDKASAELRGMLDLIGAAAWECAADQKEAERLWRELPKDSTIRHGFSKTSPACGHAIWLRLLADGGLPRIEELAKASNKAYGPDIEAALESASLRREIPEGASTHQQGVRL